MDWNSCKEVQEKSLIEFHHISSELTHLTVILNYNDYTRILTDEQSQSLANIISIESFQLRLKTIKIGE